MTDTSKYEQQISDGLAPDYERLFVREYSLIKQKYFTTCNWGRKFSGLFLDYGCGTGIASRILNNMGCKVVAFDISPRMVVVAKEQCDIPVVVANALNLPFKDKAFSVICISDALHHILDLDTAFSEIRRCTKDAICINEPTTTSPIFYVQLIYAFAKAAGSVGIIRRIYQKLTKTGNIQGSKYARTLNPDQLVQLCENHGFKVIDKRFHTHVPLLHLFLPEQIRKVILRALISNKRGTSVEIIATRE